MGMIRLKNKVKQMLYAPRKSRVLSSANLKTLQEVEEALTEGLKPGKKNKKEE